jgi:hypothetical protein
MSSLPTAACAGAGGVSAPLRLAPTIIQVAVIPTHPKVVVHFPAQKPSAPDAEAQP